MTEFFPPKEDEIKPFRAPRADRVEGFIPSIEDIVAPPIVEQGFIPPPEDDPNQFLLGLERGFYQLGTSLGGFLQIASELPLMGGLKDIGAELSQSAKDALNNTPLPNEDDVATAFSKIRFGDDKAVSDWFLQALGNSIPSMATVVVGGAAATLAAGPTAALATIGGISYILNSGEVYSNLRDQGFDRPGAAAAAGVPMAFLDVLTPRRVFGKLVWSPTVFTGGLREGAKRAAKLAGSSALIEGTTEAAQEVIGAGTESLVTGRDFLTPETMSRILNSFAQGAVAGGAFGGGAQAISDIHSRVRPIHALPPPTEQENVEAETEPTPPEVKAKEAPVEPRLEPTVLRPELGVITEDDLLSLTPQQIEDLADLRTTQERELDLTVLDEETLNRLNKLERTADSFDFERAKAASLEMEELLSGLSDSDRAILEGRGREGLFVDDLRQIAIDVSEVSADFLTSSTDDQLLVEVSSHLSRLGLEKNFGRRYATAHLVAELKRRGFSDQQIIAESVRRRVARGMLEGDAIELITANIEQLRKMRAEARTDLKTARPVRQQKLLEQNLEKKAPSKRTPQDIINNAVDVVQGTLSIDPEAPVSQKIALNQSAAKAIAPLISETVKRKIPNAQIEQLVDKRLKQQGMAGAEQRSLETQRIMNVFNSAKKFRGRKQPQVFITSRAPDAQQQVEVVKETVPSDKTVLITEPDTGRVYTKEPGGYRIEASNLADAAEASGHLVAESWLEQLDSRQRTNLEKQYVEETRNDPTAPTFGQWLVQNSGVRPELKKLGNALRFHHAVNGIRKPFGEYIEQLGLQTEMTMLDSQTASEVVDAQTSLFALDKATRKLQDKGLDGLDKHELDEFNTSLDTSGKFARTFLTLPQFVEFNQHNPRMIGYLKSVRQFWADKTAFTSRASDTRNMWMKLGKTQMDMVGRYLLDKSTQSFEQNRPFNDADKAALAGKYNLTLESVELAAKVDEDMKAVLEAFHQQLLLEAERMRQNNNEQGAIDLTAQADMDFARLSRLEFFPLTRFGKWVIQVKAKEKLTFAEKNFKKKDTVFRQQYRRKRDRDKDLALVQKRFPKDRFAVSPDVMEDQEHAFMGFPPSLLMGLESELALDPKQQKELEQLLVKLSPGAGHMKHMLKRQGIAGFSEEAARVYGDYMDHASNHFARLKNQRNMIKEINGVGTQLKTISERGGDMTSRRLVHQHMNEHYKYLMNPGNDAPAVRAFVFKWYFVGNARQLLVNLTQVPLFTWSYLGAIYGQANATKVLGGAYKDVFASIRRDNVYTEQMSQLIERAVEAGLLDQSFATEMAALGHGEGLAARMPGRSKVGGYITRLTDMGLFPFKWSEGINRRVSFVAAVRLAEEKGITDIDQLFEVGQDSVEKTQFQYERWARAPFTRGGFGGLGALPPVLFMFKSFMQGALFFYTTQPGRGRALVALLLAAGIMGLPGAEDVADITDWIVTFLGEKLGWKDPHTDARKWIRETMLGIGVNPDLAMHGASRFTMGLYGLNALAGIPVPALDLSGSLSFGTLNIGIEPLTRMTSRPISRIGGIIQEWSGVAGNIGVGLSRALFSHEAYDWYRATPPVLKSLFIAANAASGGAYTDRQGNELVPLDVYDTEQAAEVLSLALFQTQPTRLRQEREANWAKVESQRYYMLRRELLFKDMAFAHIANDPEGRADAFKAIRIYNRDAPPGLRISSQDMHRSLRARIRNRRLRELGLPSARRYQQIYRQYDPSFPVLGED